MYWGTVMPNGLVWLKEVGHRFNSQNYVQLLQEYAVLIWNLNLSPGYQIVQDNAPIHISKLVKEFMKEQQFKFMEYPPKSPDLNPMENIWKLLSDYVYQENQPNNHNELRSKIHQAVNFINVNKRDVIIKMFKDYRRRLTNVLLCGGNIVN